MGKYKKTNPLQEGIWCCCRISVYNAVQGFSSAPQEREKGRRKKEDPCLCSVVFNFGLALVAV